MDQIIQEKNSIIRDIQYEIARISKVSCFTVFKLNNLQAHADLTNFYTQKMEEHNIPVEELGFKPPVPKAEETTEVVVEQPTEGV